ncbi:hypothetical protein EJ110_NYTH14373 [Nymphaea thermarum]|nr:hypothetical protein EJ110_NYTH14373 [Nymphaea thermarum]
MALEEATPNLLTEDPEQPQAYFSMACTQTPKSMWVRGQIGGVRVVILIDAGSTHNFVSQRVATTIGYEVREHPAFEVIMGDGTKVPCHTMCKDMELEVQGTILLVNLIVQVSCSVDTMLGVRHARALTFDGNTSSDETIGREAPPESMPMSY